MVYRALAGNPRADIEWELEDLSGKVNQAQPEGDVLIQTTEETISKIGILKTARAKGISECDLLTDESDKWTIEVPGHMIYEILGADFNRRVSVEGKRMKRARLLQRIRLERMEQIRPM